MTSRQKPQLRCIVRWEWKPLAWRFMMTMMQTKIWHQSAVWLHRKACMAFAIPDCVMLIHAWSWHLCCCCVCMWVPFLAASVSLYLSRALLLTSRFADDFTLAAANCCAIQQQNTHSHIRVTQTAICMSADECFLTDCYSAGRCSEKHPTQYWQTLQICQWISLQGQPKLVDLLLHNADTCACCIILCSQPLKRVTQLMQILWVDCMGCQSWTRNKLADQAAVSTISIFSCWLLLCTG